MTRIAVVDTNVVAAGLITAHSSAPTAQMVDGMLAGAFPFAVSVALLAEYRTVLNRAGLRKYHGLPASAIETLLVGIAHNAMERESAAGPAAPDPGDQFLWDLLASHVDLCLVTGDQLLLQHGKPPAPIWTPAEFVRRLHGGRVSEPADRAEETRSG